MKRKKIFKRILLVLLLVFIVMQFFRADRDNPKFEVSNDFIAITDPPKEIESLLRNACYDCHSNETRYPWYSNVAPISWWLQDHVEEGREHLNFSNWGSFVLKKQNHKLHECAEEVEEGEMPLSSYTLTHGDANLSAKQKKDLAEWFEDQMISEAVNGE
ncbi:MAG: cytochrome C [Bacteroidetes bacterium RIFCSPHIGHO2_02_FULL_44_7]|nr:MAG: cytochrome C [Bacteroidetes bacterium RIFCSPHIGHO2_02_FULL_44_7]